MDRDSAQVQVWAPEVTFCSLGLSVSAPTWTGWEAAVRHCGPEGKEEGGSGIGEGGSALGHAAERLDVALVPGVVRCEDLGLVPQRGVSPVQCALLTLALAECARCTG